MVQKTLNYFRIPKTLFWSLLTLLIILLLYLSLKPKSFEVDVGFVRSEDFQTYIIDEGLSRFKNRRVLTAPADGINPALDFDVGYAVKKNETLYYFIWDKNIPIQSPLNGVVLKIFEKDRRSVSRGTPLLEVGDPESLEILVPLLSEEVVAIKLGQKALISKWGGAETLQAKVIRISPSAHEVVSALGVKEQRVDVFLEIENKDTSKYTLGDGFRLEVKIIKAEKKLANTLPIGALYRKGQETAVFIVDDSQRAREKIIKLGERNQDTAEILTQLPVGQKVILYPSNQIQDGVRVKVRNN